MKLRDCLTHLLLALGGLVMIFPFVWMLSLSLKEEHEIYASGLALLPAHWDFANYVEAFRFGAVGTLILNGWIVTLSILALQLLTVVPAAYVLALKRFRLNGLMFTLVLAVLLIPPQVTALPVYLLLAKLGLIDTRAALVIPFATSAFGIFLLRQVFKTIPQDLLDAARVDGASELQTLWTVAVPLAAPAIAAFALFSVVAHWNDFFWPLLVIRSLENATPPLGISMFASDEGGSEIGPMMASATLIVMPLMIAFVIARRRFIQGIAMTGIKG
ncbi:MAG: carbohydrate ABC transporter permease [Gammaproteobacteria bacterium]